jgi:ubiquinol-cytochrome c reductase iron-sulfur subunit
MSNEQVDLKRRRMLTAATAGVGAIGATAMVVPFGMSFLPSEKAKAAGAPVEVDISMIEDGQQITVEWRGKPVWVVKRTDAVLKDLTTLDDQLLDPQSNAAQQPEYAKNEARSIDPTISVLVGICTHLGCSPSYRPELAPADLGDDWKGGYFCACHGSRFDLAGRVFKSVPAPKNLEVPPHHYLTDTLILVGEDGGEA